jgi:hypothetical protein
MQVVVEVVQAARDWPHQVAAWEAQEDLVLHLTFEVGPTGHPLEVVAQALLANPEDGDGVPVLAGAGRRGGMV